MKRRNFLKTGAALAPAFLLTKIPAPVLSVSRQDSNGSTYQPGDTISSEPFVYDARMQPQTLLALCQQRTEAAVVVLYLFGGASINPENSTGGLWCADSFDDLHILRYLQRKFGDYGAAFIPVACAPVYSDQHYGYPPRVFLDEPEDSPLFQENARKFITATRELVDTEVIPAHPYFDLRHRLLFNHRADLKPGAGYGPIYDWQGRFRASDETQKYGVPTIWLVDSNGTVLEKPFSGNYYHTDPYKISYTVLDVDAAVQKYL